MPTGLRIAGMPVPRGLTAPPTPSFVAGVLMAGLVIAGVVVAVPEQLRR